LHVQPSGVRLRIAATRIGPQRRVSALCSPPSLGGLHPFVFEAHMLVSPSALVLVLFEHVCPTDANRRITWYNAAPDSATKVCFYYGLQQNGQAATAGPIAYKESSFTRIFTEPLDGNVHFGLRTTTTATCPTAPPTLIHSVPLMTNNVNTIGYCPAMSNGLCAYRDQLMGTGSLTSTEAVYVFAHSAKDYPACDVYAGDDTQPRSTFLASGLTFGSAVTVEVNVGKSARNRRVTFECGGSSYTWTGDPATMTCGSTSTLWLLAGDNSVPAHSAEVITTRGKENCDSTSMSLEPADVAWYNAMPTASSVCFYYSLDALGPAIAVGPLAYKDIMHTEAFVGTLHIAYLATSAATCPNAPTITDKVILDGTGSNLIGYGGEGTYHALRDSRVGTGELGDDTALYMFMNALKGAASCDIFVGDSDTHKSGRLAKSLGSGTAASFALRPGTAALDGVLTFTCTNQASATWNGSSDAVACGSTVTQWTLVGDVGDAASYPPEVLVVQGKPSCSSQTSPGSLATVVWYNVVPGAAVCFYYTRSFMGAVATVGPVSYKTSLYSQAPVGRMRFGYAVSSGDSCPDTPDLDNLVSVLDNNVNLIGFCPNAAGEGQHCAWRDENAGTGSLTSDETLYLFGHSAKGFPACAVYSGDADNPRNSKMVEALPLDTGVSVEVPLGSASTNVVLTFDCGGTSFAWPGDPNEVTCGSSATLWTLVGDSGNPTTYPGEIFVVKGAPRCIDGTPFPPTVPPGQSGARKPYLASGCPPHRKHAALTRATGLLLVALVGALPRSQ